MTELLDIREAQKRILAVIRKPQQERCASESARGRVLAENILSPLDLPPFENSSMDGFAVHSADLQHASAAAPVVLPVRFDIPAGEQERKTLAVGTAARILTGAPVPIGADAVIPVEKTDQNKLSQANPLPSMVAFYAAADPGDNIRFVGEDVQKEQMVLSQGRLLTPQDVGLLISIGIREVKVTQKARIAVFSSGDELLRPEEPLSAGKIYDANRYVLTGMFEAAGAEVIQLDIARDDPQSITKVLSQVSQNPPDLIVSSAGVSVGAFDYVRQVIEENGNLTFWRVNMRPGKPVAFGAYQGIPFIGLPGNPVSAYIGALVFVLPVVRHLHGLPPFAQPLVKAILDDPLESPDGRESYYRGILRDKNGVLHAGLTGHQGSGNLFSLVQANALLIVPSGVKTLPAGAEISAWPLDSSLF